MPLISVEQESAQSILRSKKLKIRDLQKNKIYSVLRKIILNSMTVLLDSMMDLKDLNCENYLRKSKHVRIRNVNQG